ncbi:fanconi-associated nuclease 1-like isoform X2 [Cimex lectularius]|nr:fanconi-associated nuclease 1-like isoform X2 [Cimex lectularius]
MKFKGTINSLSPLKKTKSSNKDVQSKKTPTKSTVQSQHITHYFSTQSNNLPLSRKNSIKKVTNLDEKFDDNETNSTIQHKNPAKTKGTSKSDDDRGVAELTAQEKNVKRKLSLAFEEDESPLKKSPRVEKPTGTKDGEKKPDRVLKDEHFAQETVTLIYNNMNALNEIFQKGKTILDDEKRKEYFMANINDVVYGYYNGMILYDLQDKCSKKEMVVAGKELHANSKIIQVEDKCNPASDQQPLTDLNNSLNCDTSLEKIKSENGIFLNATMQESLEKVNSVDNSGKNEITGNGDNEQTIPIEYDTPPSSGAKSDLEKKNIKEEINVNQLDDEINKITHDTGINTSGVTTNALIYSINRAKIYAPCIFTNETNEICRAYEKLNHDAQLLYQNLLDRKWSWIRRTSITYPKTNSISTALETLQSAGFIQILNRDCELNEMLCVMNVNELKKLCDHLKIDKNSTKPVLIKKIESIANRSGFQFSATSLKNKLANKAFDILEDELIKITERTRDVFLKLLVVSTCPYYNSSSFTPQISRLGDLKYLLQNVSNKSIILLPLDSAPRKLFNSSLHFEHYFKSVQLLDDLKEAQNNKDWAKAADICEEMYEQKFLFNTCDLLDYVHLRFTARRNLVYCLSSGINELKREKRYDKCLDCLELLLNQHLYGKVNRAKWYEQKLLIMEKYIKADSDSIYEVLKCGLSDCSLTLLGKRILSKRAESFLKKNKKLCDLKKQELTNLMSFPGPVQMVYIYAKPMPNVTTSKKQIFETKGCDGQTFFGSVEETVCNYYSKDYPYSFHDEGNLLKNMALALFFPVLYDTKLVPGVFVSEFQKQPLDWGGQEFFDKRKELFYAHRDTIMQKGLDGVQKDLETIYSMIYMKPNILFNISQIDISNMMKLLTCMTLEKVMKFALYLLEYYNERKSGFPDLTMFNNEKCAFVEVKGPSDTPSINQLLWMEKLKEFDLPVWICNVSCKVGCESYITLDGKNTPGN